MTDKIWEKMSWLLVGRRPATMCQVVSAMPATSIGDGESGQMRRFILVIGYLAVRAFEK
jgi:hypothetical protein